MSRLTATELWNLARVGRPTVVGSTVVVPITTHDIDDNEGTTALHLVDGEDLRPLTADGTAPALSPTGSDLAFLRKVDGRSQLHVMPVGGGEARRVGPDFPLGAGAPRWLPDGSGLVCAAHVYVDAVGLEDAATHRDDLAASKVTAKVTEERTYRFWDTWLTDGRTLHLFVVTLDGEVTDLTPDGTFRPHLPTAADPVEQFDIHPDGTRIAWAAADLSKDWAIRPQTELWEVPLDGTGARCLTPDRPGDAMYPRWLADGTIVFGATREIDYYATPIFLTVLDPGTLDQRPLYEAWDLNPGSWVVDPSTGDLLVTAEDQTKVHLFRVSPSGGVPEKIVGGSTLTGPVPDGTGTVYLLDQSISQPPEVVRVSVDGGTPERVTHVNDAALADLELGRVEERWFTGARGDEVQMYVVYPPDFDEDTQWPLVHMIHGGPHNSFGDMWHWRWNYHAFAAAGYVVPLVNFHGSSSFGHEFCRCIQGAWGDHPYTDIMA
ncbi:MAG: S9 family peptidase, partial [Acidimicrobiia bacterium]